MRLEVNFTMSVIGTLTRKRCRDRHEMTSTASRKWSNSHATNCLVFLWSLSAGKPHPKGYGYRSIL